MRWISHLRDKYVEKVTICGCSCGVIVAGLIFWSETIERDLDSGRNVLGHAGV